ncbi:MAG TPA: ferritin-like domain-containing protein [Thermoanaerobaculia bacterium]|jgi:ferritin-like metal-binding protein YciE
MSQARRSAPARATTPLARYRLGRAALDLRTFMAAELAALTQVPINTVYSFLADLGPRLTSETLDSGAPGRPKKRYALTGEGVEHLLRQNLEVARALRNTAGEESPEPGAAAGEPIAARGPAASGMKLDALEQLYLEELGDLYSAEKQVLQILPRMASKAADGRLKQAFEEHAELTRRQVERLDSIFGRCDRKPRARKSRGMEVLIAEVKQKAREDLRPAVRDAALISSAHKIEHYQIAGYGTVCTYAQLLGDHQAVRLLQQTLDEEGHSDRQLTRLAEGAVHAVALAEAY